MIPSEALDAGGFRAPRVENVGIMDGCIPGPLNRQPAEGMLRISPNRAGFAMGGEEKYTDRTLSV